MKAAGRRSEIDCPRFMLFVRTVSPGQEASSKSHEPSRVALQQSDSKRFEVFKSKRLEESDCLCSVCRLIRLSFPSPYLCTLSLLSKNKEPGEKNMLLRSLLQMAKIKN